MCVDCNLILKRYFSFIFIGIILKVNVLRLLLMMNEHCKKFLKRSSMNMLKIMIILAILLSWLMI
jgi:hypothetical protein